MKRRHLKFVPGLGALIGCLAALPAAGASGVVLADLTLDEALARAAELNTMVMVDVYSDHCGQCGDMDETLWETPTGAELTEGLVAIRIPSDKPAGIVLQRRYPVLGLPAVIFLDSSGTEVDRLIGYSNPARFVEEARLRKSGYDPLPEMEEELAAHPDSPQRILDVLEKYLYRRRIVEAEALLERLMELDGSGQARRAGKAIMYLAKYYAYFERDGQRSQEYWRMLVERLPNALAIGSAVIETHKLARTRPQLDAWADWICGVIERNPSAGRLCYYTAKYAHRSGLIGARLAAAARRAHELGVGPANLDSIAVILEGDAAPK